MDRAWIVIAAVVAASAVPAYAADDDGAVLGDRALVLVCEGRLAEAEDVLRQGLAIDDAADRREPEARPAVPAAHRPGIARVLARTAAGDTVGGGEAAAPRRAGERSRAQNRRPGRADVLAGLGKLLVDRGDLAEGEKFARRALRIYENESGPRRAERVDALLTLVAVRRMARDEVSGCPDLLRRAGGWPSSNTRGPSCGRPPPPTWSPVDGPGRYDEAEPHLEQGSISASAPSGRMIRRWSASCRPWPTATGSATEPTTQRPFTGAPYDMASRAYGPRSAALVSSLSGLALFDEGAATRFGRRRAFARASPWRRGRTTPSGGRRSSATWRRSSSGRAPWARPSISTFGRWPDWRA